MSRIGKLPVFLPEKVEAKILNNEIEIKGPLGVLRTKLHPKISISIDNNSILVSLVSIEDDSLSKALWGTYRANINNMVIGVTEGFLKSLEINGVGYKFEISGQKLILNIGFSHKVEVDVPKGISMTIDEKLKNIIYFKSIDKQLLGQFTSKIRAMKKPEPYKGKGIKYVGEHIRRKAGKSGK